MKKIYHLLFVLLPVAIDSNSQEPLANDIVINEILFNPVKEGFDYVEGYNRSEKTLLLNTLMVANRNSTGDIAATKLLTKDSIKIDPRGHFVVTANEKWLRQHYAVPPAAIVLQISSLPSFADDEGSVVLLRKGDSVIIDEVSYSEKWHFKMIKDPEGIALERINFNYPGFDQNNWTSASQASGSGTPGKVNSQFRQNVLINEGVAVLPKIFSPNNDGVDDFAQLNINAPEQGKIANAVVYDAQGRRVRYLVKNELLGIANSFTWDGCDDYAKKLPGGIYIVHIQVFDTRGNNNKFRYCIVLSDFRR